MAPHPRQKRDLTSGPLAGTLLRLAVPLMLGGILHALYMLADAFWLGKWSKEALAAPGVSMPFFFIVIAFGMGFGTAGTALVAQYAGAGKHREADRAAAQTLLLLSMMAVGFAAPLILLGPRLFALMQVPPAVAAQSIIYLRIVALGLPLIAFNIAYSSVLRALGDTVTVVLVTIVTNAMNLCLDPVLIFGWGGLPALGTGGAALSSLLSQSVGTVACYCLLRRHRAGLYVRLADFKPDWKILRKAFGIGFPAALGNSSDAVGFAAFQVMINTLGTATIGGFTIGFRLIHFLTIPGRAMAVAAGPVVGQALGARKPGLARRAVWASAALVAGVMFIPFALLIWQGKVVAGAFISDPGVIEEAGKFFLIVPASAYFFGVLMILNAAFYGSGHTRPVMAVSLVRIWVLRLPMAYTLGFLLGWGSLGVYTGMVVSNIVCALLTLALFWTTRWQSPVIATARTAQEDEPRS